ncbi:MAG: MmcQ/YjbR family DNA-binding protein [Bacteroidia bacterium]|nr:MmcQ/YjbR family DNA-binding protein [Bacteroidia bacterium]
MVSRESVRRIALAFEETKEDPHFDKIAFKVKGKIFATLNLEHMRACVRLSAVDQDVFCAYDQEVIYPVPNAWGKYGWTLINLKKVKAVMFKDAITSAYCFVAPARLSKKYTELF